jgi:phage tail-like protein
MSGTSSYLRYLPRVLWQGDPDHPDFSLGAALRVFEKLLTGIDDDLSLLHEVRPDDPSASPSVHEHPPIVTEVDRLPRLADPWATRSEFLPWLASWVALDLPTLHGTPLWEEYQQRRAIAKIAGIHRMRGRRAGLGRLLELYAGGARPRVALDDGTRVLELFPGLAPLVPVTGMVTQGPFVRDGVWVEGVTRPWAVAASMTGDVFLADIGAPSGLPVQLPNRVWHLDAWGGRDFSGAPPRPRALALDTLALSRVVALAVRGASGGRPETLFVLDRPGRLHALPAPWATTAATLVTALGSPGTPVWPIAMTVDPDTGDLLVLDRGVGLGSPSATALITVRTDPVTVTRQPLATVVEPLSLAVEPSGTLLIGDGGEQKGVGPPARSTNVVRVDRASAATPARLLAPDSPLAAPTAIARGDDGGWFVLDAGLKPFAPASSSPFIGPAADQPAIYQLDLSGPSATIVRIDEPGQLVYPTGMTAVGERLVICDPGHPEVAGLQASWSRLRPFVFDVVVNFATPRLPADPAARQRVLDHAVGSIRELVNAQKPAHTVWNLITSI